MTMPRARTTDPAELAIYNALLASVAEEMGVALGRTAHSPNIKERRDYSCAVFNPQGDLVAQAAHIPVHLGAMPTAIRMIRSLAPFRPGDVAILNDPYLGGTHLPDVTLASPVFAGRTLIGFVASRAHHADIGGMAPGSMPMARELWQEGVIIPPLRLVSAGRLNEDLYALILRNVRSRAKPWRFRRPTGGKPNGRTSTDRAGGALRRAPAAQPDGWPARLRGADDAGGAAAGA